MTVLTMGRQIVTTAARQLSWSRHRRRAAGDLVRPQRGRGAGLRTDPLAGDMPHLIVADDGEGWKSIANPGHRGYQAL
jgi:Cu/Zn superoxide dismutase